MLKRTYNNASPPETGTGGGVRSNGSPEKFQDEVEIKLLVEKEKHQKFHTKSDFYIFTQVENYFRRKGWNKSQKTRSHLLTRQLDTNDASLIKDGQTLRMRAECIKNNLMKVKEADICVKLEKEIDPSGALRRPEFEVKADNFYNPEFSSLKNKYPDNQPKHHRLHKFLNDIDPDDLYEYFRIDVKRRRLVVELPESETGIKGKRFCAEVLLDDVAHVIDIYKDGEPQEEESEDNVREYPFVFNHDYELEAEVLYKPCKYNITADSHKYVTSPDMTAEEVDHCMTILKEHLKRAARGRVKENDLSKAERGFIALGIIPNPHLEAETSKKQNERRLIDIFRTSASSGRLVPANENEVADILPRSPKIDVIDYRSIAFKR
jgi:hypothetical protein